MPRVSPPSADVDGLAPYPVQPVPPDIDLHAGLVEVDCICTGVTPLLVNAMSEQQLLDIWGKKKSSKTAARPTPRDEARSKLHLLPDGRPHVPLAAFYKCLINAGQFVRLDGKRQVSTAKSTVLNHMMRLLSTELPLYKPGTDSLAPWEVDIQRGRNPNGGEAVALIRPRFDLWEVRCVLQIDQQYMPLKMARDLVDISGRRMGLLDFRPQCKGTFGQFVVTLWQLTTSHAE